MRTKEVLNLLKITYQTLYNYRINGMVKYHKVNSKHFEYDDESVYAIIGIKNKSKNKFAISYSRVSLPKQFNDLKSQTQRIYDFCMTNGIALNMQYEDVKSGMNFNERKNFNVILERIIKGEISLLVIENKDRLCRFGFEMFEQICKYYGTKILIINDSVNNKSYEDELTQDLISIIHYFSMKSYSHRRKLNKLRKEVEIK